MAIVEFKSVGERPRANQSRQEKSRLPVGIKTPISTGTDREGLFEMHYDVQKQIKDNLRNLILTNRGERLGSASFGASLRELSFEHGQDEFDTEVVTRIRDAVTKFMPYVSPRTLESSVVKTVSPNTNIVRIKIIYDIPRLNVTSDVIDVVIRTRG